MYLEDWVIAMYQRGIVAVNNYAGLALGYLWHACLTGGLYILAVWLICRFNRRLSVTARCWLWWLACLKVLVGLFCQTPVPVPILPVPPDAFAAGRTVFSSDAYARGMTPTPAPSHTDGGRRHPGDLPSLAPPPPSEVLEANLGCLNWHQPSYLTEKDLVSRDAAVSAREAKIAYQNERVFAFSGVALAWIIGIVLCYNRIERRMHRLSALLRRADDVVPAHYYELVVEVAHALKLRRVPRVVLSTETTSPLVAGLFRPVVVLPTCAATELTRDEARMILAHELAHVRRADLWLAWIPLLTHGIFFFLPPLWLAVKEWVAAREVACDALAMRVTGTTVGNYGRLLIRLSATSGPFQPAGALYATGAFVDLRQRVELIKRLYCGDLEHEPSRLWLTAMVACGVLLLVPWRPVPVPARPAGHLRIAPKSFRTRGYRIDDLGTFGANDNVWLRLNNK